MNEKNDELIDSYAAAKITDAVESFCRLEAAMGDLRNSAYTGADGFVLQVTAARVRRHARKLIEELLMMDYHLRQKQEKAKQLKIIK